MKQLISAIEKLDAVWMAWSETNYNVRDDLFQEVIHAVSVLNNTYDALKDAGIIEAGQ